VQGKGGDVPTARFVHEFWDFVAHHKRWWVTVALVLLASLVALAILGDRTAFAPRLYGE